MISVENLNIDHKCPNTKSGNHVIEFEGSNEFWCKQCGKLFDTIGDEYGQYDLIPKEKAKAGVEL